MRHLFHKRADDPSSVRFRVRVLIRRYPVQFGMLLATLVTVIPLIMLIHENDALDQAQDDIRRTQNQEQAFARRNCRRGNVQNAYVRLRVKEDPLAHVIFPIIYCNAAEDGERRGVPMPDAEQEEYIRLINERRLPIVGEGGYVIGSIPFPAGGPSGQEIDTDEASPG